MGEIFDHLCKGPVLILDDRIGDNEDLINKLIEEIKSNNLPLISFKKIEEVKKILPGLLFSNFVILDWLLLTEKKEPTNGVQVGETGKQISEEEIIEFIKELKNVCLAPIFIISDIDTKTIEEKLTSAGILTEKNNYVFVESKSIVCNTKGAFILKTEKWIKDNPHIYLAKFWINELLSKNTSIFWNLFNLNPNWPVSFYHSFKDDGDDPILSLRDTLYQLVLSEIDFSSINESFLNVELKKEDPDSLKNLYKRLVYLCNNIDKDIKPGDIFKKDGEYFLNIRPECDTTKRVKDPELYLLEGEEKSVKDVGNRYDKEYGLLDRKNEIIMLFLDDKDIVRFDKRKLSIKKYSELKGYKKICRVSSSFINKWQQSYSNYIGRFGIPSYPKNIIELIFEKNNGS